MAKSPKSVNLIGVNENNEKQAFVFFGRSGSGKGTQAKLLIEHLLKTENKKSIYIETGEELRDFVAESSHTSKIAKTVLDSGGLLPVFLPIWAWTNKIIKEYTGEEVLILDGLCRRPDEAIVLDSAMKFFKVKPTIIFIKTSFEWSYDRLKSRGRQDDSDEYIKSRLTWFDTKVFPAMAYFWGNQDYTFLEIDGERHIDEVHADILTKLAATK